MAKTYRTPTVASLGTADVMTSGLPKGTISEKGVNPFTTQAMLDL